MVSRDTTNEEQVRIAEELDAARAVIEHDLLKEVLSTFEGRHVLFNILAKTGLYDDFSLADPDYPKWIGRRAVGLEVLADLLTVNPNVYTIMQQENAAFVDKYTPQYDEEDREEEHD